MSSSMNGSTRFSTSLGLARKDTLEHVMELMQELLAIDNETLEDIKSMEELYDEIRDDPLYQRLFEIANVHTAEEFGLDVPEGVYEEMAGAIEDEDEWAEIQGEDWFEAAQAMADEEDFFHWELEYPEVFFDEDGEKRADAGFDAVVGNPPYVKIQELRQNVPAQADYLTHKYESATGNFDLYVCLTQQGYELLSVSGFLGYIEPHKFFQSSFGEGLRGYLSEYSALHQVTSFGDEQVFEDATIYTCILILSGQGSDEFEYTEVGPEVLKSDDVGETNVISSEYRDEKWVFSPPHVADLLEKIDSQGPNLVDVTEKVFQGLATSADSVYIVEEVGETDNHYEVRQQGEEETFELEKGPLKPILKGDGSDRYREVQPSLRVIFPYKVEGDDELSASFISEDDLESQYPLTHQYLSDHEETLRQRESGKMDHSEWHDYVYPKNLTDYERSYIITPRLGNQPEFTYKPPGIYHNTDIEGLPLKPDSSLSERYVLGVLNSSVFWFFMTNTGSTFRSGYYTFRSEYLYPFTIPKPSDGFDRSPDEKQLERLLDAHHDALDEKEGESRVRDWIDEEHSFATLHDAIEDLVERIMDFNSDLHSLNRSLRDHLGAYSDGQTLADVGLTQPPEDSADSILQQTAEEKPNLRVGEATVKRESPNTVEIRLTARYKPDDEDAHETDQWGYTETEPLPALRITDLDETEADLIEAFVPVAVDEAEGFARFRENATKTNSLVDRLRKLTLPAVDEVREGLENYLETKERAKELEEKIDRTDELIDEIVYELYGLSDEEIEIVEETGAD
jgi:hypothetical protein